MKRYLSMIMAILFLIPVTAFAQSRGALTNVWASWMTVSNTQTTLTPPSNSRDIWIHNGSAQDICINLDGGTIQNNCLSVDSVTFQLDGASDFYAVDFVTGSISLRSASSTTNASPVSVVVTY